MPMPARRSTGKRTRFEVFKRDHFTCQYCGGQPPGVVLVVDHVDPAAAGGASTIDNLITACEPCNQGKADKAIGVRAIRPDADLLYLATQQEIAELQRYRAALAAWEAALAATIEDLQGLWIRQSGFEWCPSETLLRQLLARFAPDVVGEALIATVAAIETRSVPSYGHRWTRYLWTVARNTSERAYGSEDNGG